MSGDYVKFFDTENSSVEPNSSSEQVDDGDLKTSAFLFTKINEVKRFCEGLFDDGSFNKRIGKFNTIVSLTMISEHCFIVFIALTFA